MGNKRARKQVRLSRALGIALTPKAQRYFERRPYGCLLYTSRCV